MHIEFKLVGIEDKNYIETMAEWYLSEWNIPIASTKEKIENLSDLENEFHLVLLVNNQPVAAGGLHYRVNIQKKVPRFETYRPWLAWVYTAPEHRRKGYGEMLCNYIEGHAKELGVAHGYLYTFTAEHLYSSLGWIPLERMELEGKEIVVMEKSFKLETKNKEF